MIIVTRARQAPQPKCPSGLLVGKACEEKTGKEWHVSGCRGYGMNRARKHSTKTLCLHFLQHVTLKFVCSQTAKRRLSPIMTEMLQGRSLTLIFCVHERKALTHANTSTHTGSWHLCQTTSCCLLQLKLTHIMQFIVMTVAGLLENQKNFQDNGSRNTF